MRFFCFCLLLLVACSKENATVSLENEDLAKVIHLYEPIANPNKNDWLTLHKEESQSFANFKNTNSEEIEAVEFILIGELSQQDSSLLKKMANYLAISYKLAIGQTTQLETNSIPDSLLRNQKIQSTAFLDFLQSQILAQKRLEF